MMSVSMSHHSSALVMVFAAALNGMYICIPEPAGLFAIVMADLILIDGPHLPVGSAGLG